MYRWKSAAQNQNQNKFRKSFGLKKFPGKSQLKNYKLKL